MHRLAGSQRAPHLSAALGGVRLTLLGGILQQTTEWDGGDMDSGSKAQKTSSPRKLAERFRESLVFQEAPIAFPEYLYL